MASPARNRLPAEVKDRLSGAIPTPKCELDHHNAWQLLMATILSAQSTDRTVNRVTPQLFARYPSAAALAAAKQDDVEALVKATGFFRVKAAAIVETSRLLVEHHGGKVPKDIDALVRLKGVARKTANVVLGTAYGMATGMVVDTHVGRVSRRLGLTQQEDPVRVEKDLCEQFSKDDWVDMGHRMVLHGRYICLARQPLCDVCPLWEVCPSRESPAPALALPERQRQEQDVVDSRGERKPASAATAPKKKARAPAVPTATRRKPRAP